MALRDHRGTRPRRGAERRARFAALACVLLIAGAVSATWPAVKSFDTAFLAGGANGNGEAAAGDHLQTGYRLWLVGHQLGRGAAPWRDPYSLRPATSGTLNPAGWPFGLPAWPLYALFGPVKAWNLFVLLTIFGAGVAALAWLRALGLGRGAALAGGLAFALAPYRVQQSVGHLLGPISLLVPVALWAFEKGLAASAGTTRAARRRARRWQGLAALALVSIPLSGQVHLALGAIPFFALYALCRSRALRPLAGAGVAVVLAVAAGVALQRGVIAGSIAAQGRSLDEVRLYSAQWLDFLARSERHGSESYVLLGWATPIVALAGLALLIRSRRRGLAIVLGLGLLVPVILALGTNFPLYETLWQHVPPLRFPRVPERLMPIACLAIAALVAVAVERAGAWRRQLAPLVVALATVVLVLDLHGGVFGRSAADPGSAAYAAVHAAPPVRLTELPVFLPDVHYGSVYLYYAMQAPRQRTGGYSTLATAAADTQARSLEPLNCGDWTAGGGAAATLRRLDVSVITLHRGLFTRNVAVPDRSWYAWQGLLDNGWRPVGAAATSSATVGVITTFVRAGGAGNSGRPAPANPLGEPDRASAHYCQGWYGPGPDGIPMSRKRAPLWVYGAGPLTLRLAAGAGLTAGTGLALRISVDGEEALSRTVEGVTSVGVPLMGTRWHLVTVEVDQLVRQGRRNEGARLVGLTLAGREV